MLPILLRTKIRHSLVLTCIANPKSHNSPGGFLSPTVLSQLLMINFIYYLRSDACLHNIMESCRGSATKYLSTFLLRSRTCRRRRKMCHACGNAISRLVYGPTFPGSCSKFMNGVDNMLSGFGKNRQMLVPVATKD